MGHMNQNPKGIRSTWTAITDASIDALYEAACAAIYTTQAEYNITYAAAFKPQVCNKVHIFDVALETLYTDDCGQFPVQSFSGNQYIKCVPVLCEQSGLPVCNQMLPNSYKSLCVYFEIKCTK
jgi:hypothetical protein